MKRQNTLVLTLFTLSGVSGLVYELVWIRLLSQLLGGTTFAISAVLAAFMGGLALGSRHFGARVDAGRRPLRLYARLELGIAGLGVLVHAAILLLRPAYVTLAHAAPDGALAPLRVAIALLLLLPPTFLMGGTLPVLGRYLVRADEKLGRGLGLLYAVNTFGAVLGVFLAGFVLIPQLGLVPCTALAAAVNLLVAAGILLIDRRTPEMPPAAGAQAATGAPAAPAPDTLAPDASGIHPVVLALLFAASGFAAMGYELYWTRALDHFLGNSTYAFSTMLTTFLLGLAGGGWLGGRLADRGDSAAAWLARAQLAAALAAMATVPLIWQVLPRMQDAAWFSGAAQSWNQYLAHRFLAAMLIMIVPTLLIGMTFPLVSRIGIHGLSRLGWGVGRLYFANTLGSIAGSLAAGFLVLPLLGVKRAIVATAVLGGLIGLAVHLADRRRGRREPWLAVAVVAVLVVGAARLPGLGGNLPADDQDPADTVLFIREDPTAETSVYRKPEGTLHMAVDGHHIGGTEPAIVRKEKILAHLPLAMVPRAETTLSIGLGSGITLGTLALYEDIDKLVCVEIVPGVVDGARYFGDANFQVLQDPRVRMVVGDGVQHLLTTRDRYDVISSDSKLNPEYAGNAALLSRDYYRLCLDRLTDRGVMVQWLATHLPAGEIRTVARSFQAVFPHAAVFWLDPYNIVLAGSPAPLTMHLDRLRSFLADEELREDLALLRLDNPYVMPSLFIAADADLAAALGDGPLNTWARPRLEFTTVREFRAKPVAAHEDENLRWLNANRRESGLALSGEVDPAKLERARLVTGKILEGYAAGGGIAQLESGRRAFEEGLAAAPGDPRLTALLEVMDRYNRYLEQKAAGGGSVDLVRLGVQRLNEGRDAEALALFEKALARHPDDADLLHNRLLALRKLDRRDELRAALDDFRRRFPGDARGWSLAGREIAESGSPDDAVPYFRKAAELDPASPVYLNNLATALARSEDWAAAAAAFERVAAIDPHYGQSAYFAAASWSMAGDTAAARRWMDLCLERKLATFEQFATDAVFAELRASADWPEASGR